MFRKFLHKDLITTQLLKACDIKALTVIEHIESMQHQGMVLEKNRDLICIIEEVSEDFFLGMVKMAEEVLPTNPWEYGVNGPMVKKSSFILTTLIKSREKLHREKLSATKVMKEHLRQASGWEETLKSYETNLKELDDHIVLLQQINGN